MAGESCDLHGGEHERLDRCVLCESLRVARYDAVLRIDRCRQCGLLFDNPRPTVAAIERHYSRQGQYDRWKVLDGPIEALSRTRLRRVRRFKPCGDLLDIGAGMGHFLHVAQPYFSCAGTELSSEACAVASQRYGLDLLHGEVESLDLGSRQFDVVTMSQVLEHVPWPGRTLARCRELLKPGGVLYVSAPNEPWYSLRRVLPWALGGLGAARFRPYRRRGLRRIELESMSEIHLSHFSEPVLRRGLTRTGLVVVGAGIDFHDTFMFAGAGVQVLRYALLAVAVLLRAATGANVYNCMWMVARRPVAGA